MIIGNRTTIGFDRRIDIEWLDATAGRLAEGQSPAEIRAFLWSVLQDAVGGDTVHSARGKTLTVLMRVWVTVPSGVEALRAAAIKRIPPASADERMAIHWSMSVASYPFFADVASHVGKLMALNGQANLSQIVRRMKENWGDRSTLPRAVQRVLRSMLQWGALGAGTDRGVFIPPTSRIVLHEDLSELAIQSILLSCDGGMGLHQAMSHPALFPFDVRVSASGLRKSKQIRVLRQGDQTDFVELAAR